MLRWPRARVALAPSAPRFTPIFDSEGVAALRHRDAVTRRLLATADAFAAVAALSVIVLIAPGGTLTPALLVVAPLVVLIQKMADLYDRDDMVLRRSTLDEVPTIFQLSGLYALGGAVITQQLTDAIVNPMHIVALALLGFTLTSVGRMAARMVARRAVPAERCLVVGDEERASQVRRKLEAARGGVDVVGTLSFDLSAPHGIDAPEDLERVIREHRAHRVVIAPGVGEAADTVDLVRIAKAVGVRVSILPRVFEAVGSSVEFEQVDGMTMLGVRRFGLTRSSRAVKRAFDLLVATAALIAVAPLLAVIAAAIRLETRGPVFFRQTRIGRDGEPFEIWKFRSMVTDAEAMKDELRQLNQAGDGLFKIAEDPRITRVGRFLRRTSLDELPQLFNVLAGQMSVVGPRPLVVDEDAKIVGMYRSRLHLTPGMTGPWQVLGSTRVPLQEMVGIDYLYVANWSLWVDVKILLRTVPHVLAHRGL